MSHATSLRWPVLLPRLARFLPASLFSQLRSLPEDLELLDANEHSDIVDTLLQANKTLEPLHRVLVQYMPRYLIEANPIPGRPQGQLLEGSFIWADVTGFTALTELLAQQGQAQGRELMNQIMNRLFTEILDPLIASGGDLLIFAGDAALVFFPKPADSDDDVLQATRAALRMERAIIPFESFDTEYGPCSLTMSAGVERGVVYAGIVGTDQRMELLVSGPGIHNAMTAEVQSSPGQVTLGPQAQAIAQPHFTMDGARVVDNLGEALGDYEIFMPTRKRGSSVVFGMDIPEVLDTLEASLKWVEHLAPFVPEDMLAHMVNTEQRVRKLVSEFRPVAVQFINIIGLEELAMRHGPDIATQVFQHYFVNAQQIIARHEGIISQVDAYAQGFFLVNTFGTPKAHEGTTRYAVSAALQLDKLLHQINDDFQLDPPLQQRGGITYGLVFNGEIGAKYRRESVVAGPAVNRAARLMSKAKAGQVILDAQIWEETQSAFVGERLPPVELKGIDGQVVIINVHEVRLGTRLQPLERPLLGRQPEQAQLEQAIFNLLQPQTGSACMITGETGIGKTSLILDLASKAKRHNLALLAGRCQPHGKHIPLFVWIDLLTGWLDIDERVDSGQQRAQLTKELKRLGLSDIETALVNLLALANDTPNPSHRHMEPDAAAGAVSLNEMWGQTTTSPHSGTPAQAGGLNALLGNRLAETPQKSGKTLWKRLEERISGLRVVVQLLQALAQQHPLLIILEDTHWLDRDSELLLRRLLIDMDNAPLMLVLTGRQPLDEAGLLPIALQELSNQAIIQVAQRVLGAQGLDGTLADWVCSQANGNPLYAKELCQALQQSDSIFLDRETGQVRWTRQAPTLPLSLHELMLARLDELPLPQQDVLKRAAVLGASFEFTGLLRLYPAQTEAKAVRTALDRVVRIGFLLEGSNFTYRFNHPLMQEAVYTTLSFSQRQAWHTDIGNWLVERQTEQYLELIAYHHLRGADPTKAAEFGQRAGDRAKEQGIYAGAVEYYAQVLALEEAPVEIKQIAAESRADVLVLQQEYQAAARAYNEAIKLGSRHAAGKRAILLSKFDGLELKNLSLELQAWVEGSRARALANAGQLNQAVAAAHTALDLAPDLSRAVMQTLVHTLEHQQAMDTDEQWFQQFRQCVLLGA